MESKKFIKEIIENAIAVFFILGALSGFIALFLSI